MIMCGDKFICVHTVKMKPNEKIAYKAGHIYTSEADRCITDESGNKYHYWDEPTIYFLRVSKDSKIEYLDSPDNLELYSISKILDYTQEAIELIRDKMYENNNY